MVLRTLVPSQEICSALASRGTAGGGGREIRQMSNDGGLN